MEGLVTVSPRKKWILLDENFLFFSVRFFYFYFFFLPLFDFYFHFRFNGGAKGAVRVTEGAECALVANCFCKRVRKREAVGGGGKQVESTFVYV